MLMFIQGWRQPLPFAHESGRDIWRTFAFARLHFLQGKGEKETRAGVYMSSDDHDLSISELSLPDQTLKPFSLLAPPAPPEPDIGTEEPEEPEESVPQQPQRQSAKAREEKLQSDVFILRKLNASFELFNEALQDTGSANQVTLHFIHKPHPSYLH